MLIRDQVSNKYKAAISVAYKILREELGPNQSISSDSVVALATNMVAVEVALSGAE